MGGTTALAVASEVGAGRVATLSAPMNYGPVHAATALAGMQAPVLVPAAERDDNLADQARTIKTGLPTDLGTVVIVPGAGHGTTILDKRVGARTVSEVLSEFVLADG